MKKSIIIAIIILGNIDYGFAQLSIKINRLPKYYYSQVFDWHWDIRVRISDGRNNGLLSPNETYRLYNRLKHIESNEFQYQSDGYYSSFEQQRIWNEVIYLNKKIGIELTDCDRNFYGFDARGVNRRGFGAYFDRNGCDFNRFDKKGFGSIQYGFKPRYEYQNYCQNNQYAHDDHRYNNNDRYDQIRNERQRLEDEKTRFEREYNNRREQERKEQERREQDRREQERREQDRREQERREQDRREQERREQERREQDRREQERRGQERYKNENYNNKPQKQGQWQSENRIQTENKSENYVRSDKKNDAIEKEEYLKPTNNSSTKPIIEDKTIRNEKSDKIESKESFKIANRTRSMR